MGEYYIFINGEQVGYPYWYRESAEAAVDAYLWKNMVIG
jgi:hypothetical protein